MRYDPENAKVVLLPDGWYDAEIANAVEGLSKGTQRPQLVVTFKVFHESSFKLMDSYFQNDVPSMLTRLKKLCAAIGHDFSTGEVGPGDLMGKTFKANVKTQKEKDPRYDDKNVVAGYRNINDEVQPQTAVAMAGSGETADHGDSIPF